MMKTKTSKSKLIAPSGKLSTDGADSLKRLPATGFYEPVLPGKNEKMLFLLWDTKTAPDNLTLDKIWSDKGLPPYSGYLLFFDTLPTALQVPSVEKQMRKLLTTPPTTAVGWIKYAASTDVATVSTLLKTKLDSEKRPCVDGETHLNSVPGVKTIIFPNAALLVGRYDSTALTGLVSSFALSPQSPVSDGLGVSLPLKGGIDGKLVGCVRFLGLSDAFSRPKDPTHVLKSLMDVSIDPLHPLDTSRNYQIFTGQNYLLSGKDGHYNLSPAN
jgi:hypothetical protein